MRTRSTLENAPNRSSNCVVFFVNKVLSSQLKPNPIQIELHSKEEMADEVLRWATIDGNLRSA